jgi:hypothetical protein
MGGISVSEKMKPGKLNTPMTDTSKRDDSWNHYLDTMRMLADEVNLTQREEHEPPHALLDPDIETVLAEYYL